MTLKTFPAFAASVGTVLERLCKASSPVEPTRSNGSSFGSVNLTVGGGVRRYVNIRMNESRTGVRLISTRGCVEGYVSTRYPNPGPAFNDLHLTCQDPYPRTVLPQNWLTNRRRGVPKNAPSKYEAQRRSRFHQLVAALPAGAPLYFTLIGTGGANNTAALVLEDPTAYTTTVKPSTTRMTTTTAQPTTITAQPTTQAPSVDPSSAPSDSPADIVGTLKAVWAVLGVLGGIASVASALYILWRFNQKKGAAPQPEMTPQPLEAPLNSQQGR